METEVERALLSLGLEAEEARLFRLLVTQGPCTVARLAPAAGLSRTKVYSVLDGMVAKGHAVLVADQPRTYGAIDPEVLIERRMVDLGSARAIIETELSPLYDDQDRSSSMSLRGRAALRLTEDMLRRAKRDIVFVISFVPKGAVSSITTLLDEVRARGVRVRTVVSDALIDSALLGRLRSLSELRVGKVPRAGMLIVDDEEVLIGSLDDGAGPETGGIIHGLWSRDRELIKLQMRLFEDIYEEGVA
jgi:sugar-specific transcriptional regulator TrmB